VFRDVAEHWYLYVSIPVMAAVIGYVTKLVAIRMMFLPLDYVGRKPFGWQGIVPRRAARMASIACDMMTSQLVSPADVVRRLDPERIAKELAEPWPASWPGRSPRSSSPVCGTPCPTRCAGWRSAGCVARRRR
jgi:hypothetical protein